jgi:hypothetical protein
MTAANTQDSSAKFGLENIYQIKSAALRMFWSWSCTCEQILRTKLHSGRADRKKEMRRGNNTEIR